MAFTLLQEEDVDRDGEVDTIDYADLTGAELIGMALDDGVRDFKDAVVRRRTTSSKLHLRLCQKRGSGEWNLDGVQRFINNRAWKPTDTLDQNTYGKALVCSMHLMDSDAARRLGLEIPASVKYTTGGVYACLEEVLEDGTVLFIEVIVAASGVQGVLDKVIAGKIADSYCAYWILREKALWARRQAAASGA